VLRTTGDGFITPSLLAFVNYAEIESAPGDFADVVAAQGQVYGSS